jgi:D-beta-D-heptose 7-phosphate kinase/D-beta-D-heptose 1-phosphate adenosyltransferase
MNATSTCLLDRFVGRRVLVVGDLMLDEYLWGEATRMSAEAPVPVIEVRERTLAPGGTANVAANVASLGGTAVLGGVVGSDAAGERLIELLREKGIDVGGAIVDEGRPTTAKVRLMARGQQVARMDHEVRAALPAAAEEALMRWVGAEMGSCDACILSDYGKGAITARVAATAIGLAWRGGIPVVVDPKGTDYAKYRGATVIKPNVCEVERLLKEELTTLAELERAGSRLVELLDGTAVLVTRGAEGMALFRAGLAAWHVPTAARQVFDVTGAGDTVVSALALGLAAGAGLKPAIRLASRAAGLAVARRGTAAIGLAELRGARRQRARRFAAQATGAGRS